MTTPSGPDPVQRLGDGGADALVLLGGDRRHVGEVLDPGDVPGAALQLGHDQLGRVLDAPAQQHRVCSLLERLHALANDGLRQQSSGRGPVTGDIAGFVGHLSDQLGAHVLQRIGELDLTRDRNAVVGDRGRAGQPLQHDVAALGPERDLYRVGELVDARRQQLARLVVEEDDLSHL